MKYLQILKERKLKATPQRLSILKVLARHEHPSIDELYEQIRCDYPAISLATVYKNLNTMIDEGLVVEILIPNDKSKYDIFESEHIHLVCKNCKSVYDLSKDDAMMDEYQQNLQKKLQNNIDNVKITAFLSSCANCK